MRKGVLTMVLVMVLAVGCSGPSNSSGTTSPDGTGTSEPTGGGTSPPDTTATSEPTGEPAPEPTDPESTQTKQRKPSIETANAPIGGDNPDINGVKHCAPVNWLGKKPLPDGTTVTIDGIGLGTGDESEGDSAGVFTLDQSACPGSRRPCTNVSWQPDDLEPCYVGARQIASSGEDVNVIIHTIATCATREDCKSLTEGFGGSQVSFFPEELETTPSETPTSEATPSETPTSEANPSETPSDG